MAETIKEEIEAVSKGSEHFTENEAGGIGLAVLPVDAAHKEAIKEHIAELAPCSGEDVTTHKLFKRIGEEPQREAMHEDAREKG